MLYVKFYIGIILCFKYVWHIGSIFLCYSCAYIAHAILYEGTCLISKLDFKQMTNDHPARVVVFDSLDITASLSLHFSKLLKAAAISTWTVLVFSQLAVAQTFSNRHELFRCLCRPFHMFASLHRWALSTASEYKTPLFQKTYKRWSVSEQHSSLMEQRSFVLRWGNYRASSAFSAVICEGR